MPMDRTKDKERFAKMLKDWVEQFALSLANSDTKNYIQQLVIEPFLQYILQRSFPYVIIVICNNTFVLPIINRK